jgi:hypothetical protein
MASSQGASSLDRIPKEPVGQPPAKWSDVIGAQVRGTILGVLGAIKEHRYAWPFLEPVPPGTTGYFEMIDHPMDISTIEAQLLDQTIATLGELDAAFALMFSNCAAYNAVNINGGEIFLKAGNGLRKVVERKLSKVKCQAGVSTNSSEPSQQPPQQCLLPQQHKRRRRVHSSSSDDENVTATRKCIGRDQSPAPCASATGSSRPPKQARKDTVGINLTSSAAAAKCPGTSRKEERPHSPVSFAKPVVRRAVRSGATTHTAGTVGSQLPRYARVALDSQYDCPNDT